MCEASNTGGVSDQSKNSNISATYFQIIRPVMIELARQVEPRAYRREPDFRLHLTTCIGARIDLRAGSRQKPLRPEGTTIARYSWTSRQSKRGNFDYVLYDTNLECNYAYAGVTKIEQDLIKLIDAENQFAESAYLVFGHSTILRERVNSGFVRALSFLIAKHSVVCLSRSLNILLIEDSRTRHGRGSLRLWEANVSFLDGRLDWHEVTTNESNTASTSPSL